MTARKMRRHPRRPFIAEIRYRSDSPPVIARITDLSEGGMFVDTVDPPADGTRVSFSFHIPDNFVDIAVTGTGRVVWGRATVGMGVEFLRMDGISGDRVRRLLESL